MPARKSRAWESAYKTAMMWQRRARAKDSRLRKRGVTNIEDISPVKPAKEVQTMTIYELRRYAHELNNHVDRNVGAVKQLASGEGIRRQEYRKIESEIKRNVAAENQRRAKHRAALDSRATGDIREQTTQERIAQTSGFSLRTLKPEPAPRGTGSVLSPITMGEEPRTLNALRTRLAVSRRWRGRTTADVIASQRKSVSDMLDQVMGYENRGSGKLIKGLSDMQLSYAIERLGLLDLLGNVYQSKSDYENGNLRPYERSAKAAKEYADRQTEIENVLAIAKKVRR